MTTTSTPMVLLSNETLVASTTAFPVSDLHQSLKTNSYCGITFHISNNAVLKPDLRSGICIELK